MKYKENDEIWIKARIESINSGTDRFLPYHVSIEANGKNSDGFLTYINISDKCETKPVEDKCSCLHEEYGKQVCYGTKECEECLCDGDQSECDFYPEKRQKYFETASEEDLFARYANIYQSFLNRLHSLNYSKLLEIFDLDEYRFRTKADIIMELNMLYRPKRIIEIYNQYKKQFVVYQNDIIEDIKQKKEFLVTKIEDKGLCMISRDGDVRTSNHKYLTDNIYRKTGKNMTIQEFFSKEV